MLLKLMPKKKITEKTKEANSSAKEVEAKIIELGKTGMTSEKIGLELKRQGIYAKQIVGRKINQILKENGMDKEADIKNLEEKVSTLKVHFGKNKHDFQAKRKIIEKDANLRKKLKIKAN